MPRSLLETERVTHDVLELNHFPRREFALLFLGAQLLREGGE